MSTVPPGGPMPGAASVPAVTAGSVVVDRYRLEQPAVTDLADASVWQARDTILDRPVRVTFLDGSHATSALDAARRAALVSDPRLSRVLDVGTTRISAVQLAYVVTEPYTGSTLTEIVSSGLVDAQQARAVVGEAAAALDLAAQRGVHHLALRPDAVRVDGHRVVVTGLGLDAGLAGVEGAGLDGAASDARDLAALAYYALTARWAGDSLDEPWLASDVVRPLPAQVDEHGVPVPLTSLVPHVDPVLDGLVRRALGSAGDGPTGPGDVAAALRPWGEVSVVAALPGFVQPSGGAPVRQSVRPAPGAVGTAPGGAPVRRPTGRIARASSIPAAGAAGVAGAAASGAVPPPPPPPPGYAAPGGAYPGSAYPATAGYPQGAAYAQPGAAPQQTPPPWDPQYAQQGYGQPAAGPQGYAPQAAAPQGYAPPPAATAGPPTGATPFTTEAVPRRRGVNPTPIVLGILLVAVILAAGWAIRTALAPSDGTAEANVSVSPSVADGTTAPADGGATAAAPPATEVRPIIQSGDQVDPFGNGQGEKPEAAPLAWDGDPSTFWYTYTYNSPQFGGLKEGVGYVITLREPAPVNSITLLTNSTGGNVQVRKTTADKPTEGPVLAEGPFAPTTELKFAQPEVGDTFVLWITELPQSAGRNRLELNEITLQ
ncbi:hypothetical protein [Xylanimonas protaetiae]|uniref:Protein kinase domain-containing protein n=1 Tax=Xylanimonas protaetiae TaxID=2509457 RepID=A0A4V0YG04_9MICO|nr:hypothetical protein [Xylanimonas protaetiae]QAY69521.1 hypothetical protein ET471_05235 [Xylanimonas protaetiae]